MTQMLLRFALVCSMLTVSVACGDDDSGATDTGSGDADTTDTSADDAAPDVATDTGAADTGTMVDCFNLSGATVGIPFALNDSLDDMSDTWLRPEGDSCPAEGLTTDEVPFVAYTYCNDSGETKDYRFEVLADDDATPVYIAAYAGARVPDDALACAAANEPILGIAEVIITMEPDQIVTIVSTLVDPGEADVTSVAGPTE